MKTVFKNHPQSSPPPPLAGLRLSRILAQWAVNSGMGGSLLGHKVADEDNNNIQYLLTRYCPQYDQCFTQSCRVFKRGRRVEGTEISGFWQIILMKTWTNLKARIGIICIENQPWTKILPVFLLSQEPVSHDRAAFLVPTGLGMIF